MLQLFGRSGTGVDAHAHNTNFGFTFLSAFMLRQFGQKIACRQNIEHGRLQGHDDPIRNFQ
jgi:hypothetical protein